MNKNFSRLAFLCSCALLVFLYGIAVGHYEMFPYSTLISGRNAVSQVLGETGMMTGLRPTYHLYPSRKAGAGVTHLEENRITPGLTFMSGFFDDLPEMRLIRADGSLVNRWYISPDEAFPNPTHIQPEFNIPKTEWNQEVHGALALPDGSVVFNMMYIGMVKLDRCSALQWTVPRMTHHSVELAEGGGFWTLGRNYVEEASEFLPVEGPYYEDTLLKISSDGKILSETSLPRLLYDDDVLRSIYLASGREMSVGLPRDGITELLHSNDVEELGSDMADRFPQFAAGDLLVSLRNQHLVMVLDPVTYAIKWYQIGPWIRQHDPDFTPRGTISIFNNNKDMTRTGTLFGGSNIMEVDPVTRVTKILYGTGPDQHMYSGELGKHQLLSGKDPHILITEPEAGRVIEVDSEGRIVWEFINRYDDDDVAKVLQAIRYPEDYFQVEDWTCP